MHIIHTPQTALRKSKFVSSFYLPLEAYTNSETPGFAFDYFLYTKAKT